MELVNFLAQDKTFEMDFRTDRRSVIQAGAPTLGV